MPLEFKSMVDLDRGKYFELSQKCFPHLNLRNSLFKWHFFQYPLRKRRNYTIIDKESIVGIVSALPIKIKYNNSIINGSLLTNGMIDPSYSGRNLFVDLEKFTINEEKKNGVDILLGVPNKRIFRSHLKVGFRVIGNLDFIGKFSFKKNEHNCVKIDSFNSDFNNFQDRISQNSNLMVYKDCNYLNWRYVQRPDKNYHIYTIMDNNDITGWIVISLYDHDGYLKTHIVDIQAINFSAFEKLIKCAEGLALGRHELNCWQLDHSIYYDWFKNLNFFPTIEKNIFMMMNLGKNMKNPHPSKWWFALGDNDVY